MDGKRKILAPLLVALVAATGFLAGYTAGQPAAAEAEPGIQIIPILRVYHNGELAYEKVGDPPTHNLAHLFAATIAPVWKVDGTGFTLQITALDGSSVSPVLYDGDAYNEFLYEHSAWVVAGTGTNPPSLSDYSIQLAGYGEAKVVNYYFDENQTAWVLIVSGSIQFDAAYNITEVGLATDAIASYTKDDPATYPARNALVLRDLLPQPITVNAGDVVEVQYEIVIDLP